MTCLVKAFLVVLNLRRGGLTGFSRSVISIGATSSSSKAGWISKSRGANLLFDLLRRWRDELFLSMLLLAFCACAADVRLRDLRSWCHCCGSGVPLRLEGVDCGCGSAGSSVCGFVLSVALGVGLVCAAGV